MTAGVQTILETSSWSLTICLLLIISLIFLLPKLLKQPSFSEDAPKLLDEGYPVLGMLRFVTDSYQFYMEGVSASRTGNFSFYCGNRQVVGLSGPDGRKAFFESKALDLAKGYTSLLGAGPSVKRMVGSSEEASTYSSWPRNTLIRMMAVENLIKAVPHLVNDAVNSIDRATNLTRDTGIMQPFSHIYYSVYQSTMRIIGADEIAESYELCSMTLGLFKDIAEAYSPTRMIFPWLPTPVHVRRVIASARLYMAFSSVVQERKVNKRGGDDALQSLIDSGKDTQDISIFMLNTVFAGQLNTPVITSWLLIYLSTNPYWMDQVRKEVDAVLSRHGTPDESPQQTFQRLPLSIWESEFPLTDLCMRECLRLQVAGPAYRWNSGDDLPIKGTGEVVPKDAFALYFYGDVHFNPDIYPNPYVWDPTRYLSDRSEDKTTPFGYLPWGGGRHPCLGMRLAKVNVTIVTALFVSKFDFSLCDEMGNIMTDPPLPSRHKNTVHGADVVFRLKYSMREGR